MSKDSKVLPILMFCALPASGKSESRRFFKSLTPEEMAQFHLGDSSVQVDDYPYVDALEKIDAFCKETLGTTIFKDPETRLFFNGYEWGVLTYLINEDYLDIQKLDKCFDLCKTLLHDKYNNIPQSLEMKTIIFEFSRR